MVPAKLLSHRVLLSIFAYIFKTSTIFCLSLLVYLLSTRSFFSTQGKGALQALEFEMMARHVRDLLTPTDFLDQLWFHSEQKWKVAFSFSALEGLRCQTLHEGLFLSEHKRRNIPHSEIPKPTCLQKKTWLELSWKTWNVASNILTQSEVRLH